MDSYETLELTRPADGVAVLTLTRPRQRNAITFQMFDEMHDLLAKVRADADIRALIVTGEGEGFCAGLDLDDAEELPRMSANEMMLGQEHWAGAFERFHDLPQAVAIGKKFITTAIANSYRIKNHFALGPTPPRPG